jgi:hypothetical protein
MPTMLQFLDLPVDVVDHILEFLQDNRENRDLKSCSLVCQTWFLSSRRLLYRSVTLKSRTACANLYARVCSIPPIAPLIRELHVPDYPMLPARWVTSEASLPPLLDALPRLRALFFAYQDWVRYSLALKHALCRAVCEPREGHGMGVLSLSTHPLRWETTPAHTDAPQLKSLRFKVEQRDVLTFLSSALGGIEYLHLDALLLQCVSFPFPHTPSVCFIADRRGIPVALKRADGPAAPAHRVCPHNGPRA